MRNILQHRVNDTDMPVVVVPSSDPDRVVELRYSGNGLTINKVLILR